MKSGSCAGSFFAWRGAARIPRGQQTQQLFHRLAATRTGYDVGRFLRREGCRADEQGLPGVEGDALAFGFGCGMAKSMVTDRPQAARQDVPQVRFKFGLPTPPLMGYIVVKEFKTRSGLVREILS